MAASLFNYQNNKMELRISKVSNICFFKFIKLYLFKLLFLNEKLFYFLFKPTFLSITTNTHYFIQLMCQFKKLCSRNRSFLGGSVCKY